MLEVLNLSCKRGHQEIFQSISFVLKDKQIMQVIGVNGSGKSTLLKALLGVIAHSGRIERRVDKIFYSGHSVGLYQHLSAAENLQLLATLYDVAISADEALERFYLQKFKHRLTADLSTGNRKKLRLSILPYLYPSHSLWLLDEPYAHLDRQSVEILQQIIYEHRDSGGSCIITSHQHQIDANQSVELIPC